MKNYLFPVLCLALAAFWGCGRADNTGHAVHGDDVPTTAVAMLHPTQGSNVRGRVTFTREAAGIRVVAEITGLQPGQLHGFHIHEFGDCSAPDATSAGGHFNPYGMPHAGPDAEQRHVGDLGNLQADANGTARMDRVDAHLAFAGANSVLGRSVIVHAQADDLETQPTGDAGGRVACGIIGVR